MLCFDDMINKIVFILDIMIMSAMESKREKWDTLRHAVSLLNIFFSIGQILNV